MYLINQVLKMHDNKIFNIYIYSFTKEEDEYTQSLKQYPFNFRSINLINDKCEISFK